MVDLFVDIETAPDFTAKEYLEAKQEVDSGSLTRQSDPARYWKFAIGSLSPFEGRAILITYQINDGPILRLKEWEGGEKAMLERFYNTVTDLQKGQGDWLRIIGHNILGFDMNFLYNRMVHHGIAEAKWLYMRMLKKPLTLDILQMHLPVNGCSAMGLKHDVLAHAYGLPTKDTSGAGEADNYFAGDYEKVLEYSGREFIYRDMFSKIESEGLVSKEALQESIAWYKAEHPDS